jgi:hypothetical protein
MCKFQPLGKFVPKPYLHPFQSRSAITLQQLQSRRLNRSAALNALNTFILFNIPDIYMALRDPNDSRLIASVALNVCFVSLCTRGVVSTLIFLGGHRELWITMRRRMYGNKMPSMTTSVPTQQVAKTF